MASKGVVGTATAHDPEAHPDVVNCGAGCAYRILGLIAGGSGWSLYFARSVQHGGPVMLKLLVPGPVLSEQIAGLRRQYAALWSLNVDGIVKPLALFDQARPPMMLLEHVAGESFEAVLQRASIDVATCLRLACQLARIVAGLRRHRQVRAGAGTAPAGAGAARLFHFRQVRPVPARDPLRGGDGRAARTGAANPHRKRGGRRRVAAHGAGRGRRQRQADRRRPAAGRTDHRRAGAGAGGVAGGGGKPVFDGVPALHLRVRAGRPSADPVPRRPAVGRRRQPAAGGGTGDLALALQPAGDGRLPRQRGRPRASADAHARRHRRRRRGRHAGRAGAPFGRRGGRPDRASSRRKA
jgi:hypothetical protein